MASSMRPVDSRTLVVAKHEALQALWEPLRMIIVSFADHESVQCNPHRVRDKVATSPHGFSISIARYQTKYQRYKMH